MVSMLVIFEQFSNALLPIAPTFVEIFNVLNDVLFWNALLPIERKLPPSATAGIREQFPNAPEPIVRIFPAMVSVLVILLQPKNVLVPMAVTLSGIFMVPNVVQLSNADVPIPSKLPPSATAGILLQPSNALVPIDVIFPAIVKVLVILLQS
jgi:hypothetical protein